MNNDLLRSYQQYRWQQQNGFLRLSILTKIGLSFIFFLVLLYSLFPRKKISCTKVAIVDYGQTETLRTVYITLDLPSIENKTLRKTLPYLPDIFFKDLLDACSEEWRFVAKNLPFLGVLALRCGQYYGAVQKQQIKNLIVMQEYSYYMSYLTRLLEYEEKHLFNIMHGIPGKEASYFRFTRCFVWGEYFKNYYIANHADPEQFIISGSIYHQSLKDLSPLEATIDILYMMQGDEDWVISHDELAETFQILEILCSQFKIICKRHPLYPNQFIPPSLSIAEGSPTKLIQNSKIVLSHHSTSLLDALVLGKHPLAFVKRDREDMLHFLPKEAIITTKEMLLTTLLVLLDHHKMSTIKSVIDNRDASNIILQTLKGFK